MCDERRVLVVDDTAPIRELLHDVLTSSGHLVTTADHGAHGLHLIDAAQPCVILLDLHMPVMNDWEFMHAYRQKPLPHAFIIVMTAMRHGAFHSAALQVSGHVQRAPVFPHRRAACAATTPPMPTTRPSAPHGPSGSATTAATGSSNAGSSASAARLSNVFGAGNQCSVRRWWRRGRSRSGFVDGRPGLA